VPNAGGVVHSALAGADLAQELAHAQVVAAVDVRLERLGAVTVPSLAQRLRIAVALSHGDGEVTANDPTALGDHLSRAHAQLDDDVRAFGAADEGGNVDGLERRGAGRPPHLTRAGRGGSGVTAASAEWSG
jgi:hypothetical protein